MNNEVNVAPPLNAPAKDDRFVVESRLCLEELSHRLNATTSPLRCYGSQGLVCERQGFPAAIALSGGGCLEGLSHRLNTTPSAFSAFLCKCPVGD